MASHTRLLRQESRQESLFMHEIGGYLSLVASCREDGTPTVYPSFEIKRDRRGNKVGEIPVTCRVQDIVNHHTFGKFCKAMGYTTLISLSQAEAVRDAYVIWIRKFSERYENLDMDGQAWLRKVALKAVKTHIGEDKWMGWWQSEDKDNPDEDYWIDKNLRNFYGFCYLIRTRLTTTFAELVASVTRKVIKEPENQELRSELIREIVQQVVEEVADMLFLSPVREVIRDNEAQWQQEDRKEAMRTSSHTSDADEVAI